YYFCLKLKYQIILNTPFFFWTKRPLKKEKKKDKIMVEKEQIFYKSQVVLVRKLTNLTQN
ncbi:hypothetical protein, partial [Faecalibacillus faecis]